jgi:surface protein
MGTINVGSSISKNFKIKNSGSSPLSLNGTPAVTITGSHASNFTVSVLPNNSIAGGDSTIFSITFTPSDTSTRNAIVTIVNNDGNENPYTFAIRGYGVNASNGGRPFVTTWKTDNSYNPKQIEIPTTGTGYNYSIDWENDGVYDTFNVTGNAVHEYANSGTYQVAVKGYFPRIFINQNGRISYKLLDINQWGDIAWESMESAFSGCYYLQISATDLPNLNLVSSLKSMFSGCTELNGPINIGSWNTSNINDMSSIFQSAHAFNQSIESWNTTKVTNMRYMFNGAKNFNQNIGSWITSKVLYMDAMFTQAYSFNQDISNWDVDTVGDFSNMFENAINFNQDLKKWDIRSVNDIAYMFNRAKSFNQNLGPWGAKLNSNVSLVGFLDSTALSVANYDSTLIGFNNSNTTYNITNTLGAANLKYCASANERANLLKPTSIGGRGWKIIGDDISASCNTNGVPVMWRGGTSDDWHTATNWSPTFVPGNTNEALIIDTTVPYMPHVKITKVASVGKVTTAPGNSVTVDTGGNLIIKRQ